MPSKRLKLFAEYALMLFIIGLIAFTGAFVLSEIKKNYDPHSCSINCFDSEFIDYHNETIVNELYHCLSDCRIIRNEGISPSLGVSYVNWVPTILVAALGGLILFFVYLKNKGGGGCC